MLVRKFLELQAADIDPVTLSAGFLYFCLPLHEILSNPFSTVDDEGETVPGPHRQDHPGEGRGGARVVLKITSDIRKGQAEEDTKLYPKPHISVFSHQTRPSNAKITLRTL